MKILWVYWFLGEFYTTWWPQTQREEKRKTDGEEERKEESWDGEKIKEKRENCDCDSKSEEGTLLLLCLLFTASIHCICCLLLHPSGRIDGGLQAKGRGGQK